jgi:hypothetical protein
MYLSIEKCLKENNYKVPYFQNRVNINDWLKKLASDFEEFNNTQKKARMSLEK